MKDSPLPAVVTGGAGFTGAALVSALRKDAVPVTVLDRVDWAQAFRLHEFDGTDGFVYHQVEIEDPDRLGTLLEGASVVYHLSANTENRGDRAGRFADLRSTVAGTVGVLEALASQRQRTVHTVVLTSSQLVYAPVTNGDRITEHTGVLAPASRFAAGKMAAEGFLSAYADELGLTAVSCRLSNIIGPGTKRGIVHDIVARLADDPHRIRLLGNGRQTRSYLHVDDCVAALRAAAAPDTGRYEVINVCNTDSLSAATVARLVAEEFPHGTPEVVTVGGDSGWRGDVPTLAVWPEKLLARGWRPGRTSSEAVTDTARALLTERFPAAPASG
ncbi:MAG: NAD-dependent epimerase/dehydratase family protein [Streptomycetaceae bacterium]|nr:NAD-dependent epimerase/dehydratase family protein [Streptomycetaceae bacterium]